MPLLPPGLPPESAMLTEAHAHTASSGFPRPDPMSYRPECAT